MTGTMRPDPVHAKVDGATQHRTKFLAVVVRYGAAVMVGGMVAMNLMWSRQVSGSVTIYTSHLLSTDIVIANSGAYEVFPIGVDVGELKHLRNTGWFSNKLSCCFELVLLPRYILSWRE